MPFVAMTTGLPPPTATVLHPNPLATNVRPSPAIDQKRFEQKRVLLSAGGSSFSDDETRIADRRGYVQDIEVARGKIAQRVEIEHLPVRIKKRAFGVVAGRRRSDDHSGRVRSVSRHTGGGAGSASEGAQIGDTVTELRLNPAEPGDEKEYCRET